MFSNLKKYDEKRRELLHSGIIPMLNNTCKYGNPITSKIADAMTHIIYKYPEYTELPALFSKAIVNYPQLNTAPGVEAFIREFIGNIVNSLQQIFSQVNNYAELLGLENTDLSKLINKSHLEYSIFMDILEEYADTELLKPYNWLQDHHKTNWDEKTADNLIIDWHVHMDNKNVETVQQKLKDDGVINSMSDFEKNPEAQKGAFTHLFGNSIFSFMMAEHIEGCNDILKDSSKKFIEGFCFFHKHSDILDPSLQDELTKILEFINSSHFTETPLIKGISNYGKSYKKKFQNSEQ